LGQCKRAKQRALFDYEGGLKEHYGRLWEYRHAILDSNPGSTCRLDDEETKYGNYYFRRIYVCFKGVKEGWLAGCRKAIRVMLMSTNERERMCHVGWGNITWGGRGVAFGTAPDANNQMYPIAWAVVKVENNDYWCWFISLIQEDLHLKTGKRLTIISDSHKGLLEGVTELLLNAEHKKCTRHLFANYKKNFSGVQLQCLFWNDALTTVEQLYISKMEELKRLVEMNRVARNWDHSITPSIKKRLELLKIAQRDWMVIPSGFGELEVRKGHESYRVNIHLRKLPKPPKVLRPPAARTVYGTHASARVRGRGSMGGRGDFIGRGKGSENMGESSTTEMSERGMVRVREEEVMVREEEFVVHLFSKEITEDEIRKNVEHDYMEELLLQEEQKLQNYETKQDKFDQEALRLGDYEAEELEKQVAKPIVAVTPCAEPIASATHSTDKEKQVAEPQGK
nr:hypothetical protein CTI12_AA176900 [Tanacetum cinerariifolium]